MTMTANDAIAAMLALYVDPGTWVREGIAQDAAGCEVAPESPEAVAWSLEGALYRVVGDWEDPDVAWSECTRRQTLVSGVYEACGVDLAAFGDIAHRQSAVVSVLRAGLA